MTWILKIHDVDSFFIHKTVFRVIYMGLRTWPGIAFPTVIYSWVRKLSGCDAEKQAL